LDSGQPNTVNAKAHSLEFLEIDHNLHPTRALWRLTWKISWK